MMMIILCWHLENEDDLRIKCTGNNVLKNCEIQVDTNNTDRN